MFPDLFLIISLSFIWIWSSDFLNLNAKFYIYPCKFHFVYFIHDFTLLRSLCPHWKYTFPPTIWVIYKCSKFGFLPLPKFDAFGKSPLQHWTFNLFLFCFVCIWLSTVLLNHTSVWEITRCEWHLVLQKCGQPRCSICGVVLPCVY